MSLEAIWLCADTPDPILGHEDVTAHELATLAGAGFLRECGPRREIACPSCAEAAALDVYADHDGLNRPLRFTAYCPGCGRFEVDPRLLLYYRVDFSPLVACLAEGLGTKSAPEERVPGRIWRLGQKRLAGRPFYLWIVRGAGWTGRNHLSEDALPDSGVVFLLGSDPGKVFADAVSTVPLRDFVVWDGAPRLDLSACEQAIRDGGGKTARPKPKASTVPAARLKAVKTLKAYLTRHIRDERDRYRTAEAEGHEYTFMPLPSQNDLARITGLHPSTVSRALRKSGDRELELLVNTAKNENEVIRFSR